MRTLSIDWYSTIIVITIITISMTTILINCCNLSDTGPSLLPCATCGVVQRKGWTLNLDQNTNWIGQKFKWIDQRINWVDHKLNWSGRIFNWTFQMMPVQNFPNYAISKSSLILELNCQDDASFKLSRALLMIAVAWLASSTWWVFPDNSSFLKILFCGFVFFFLINRTQFCIFSSLFWSSEIFVVWSK